MTWPGLHRAKWAERAELQGSGHANAPCAARATDPRLSSAELRHFFEAGDLKHHSVCLVTEWSKDLVEIPTRKVWSLSPCSFSYLGIRADKTLFGQNGVVKNCQIFCMTFTKASKIFSTILRVATPLQILRKKLEANIEFARVFDKLLKMMGTRNPFNTKQVKLMAWNSWFNLINESLMQITNLHISKSKTLCFSLRRCPACFHTFFQKKQENPTTDFGGTTNYTAMEKSKMGLKNSVLIRFPSGDWLWFGCLWFYYAPEPLSSDEGGEY